MSRTGNDGRVLVVGAGPAGLTVALGLARRGIVPRVVDAADGPSPLSRAVGVFPQTLRSLPRELADQLVAASVVIRSARLHRGTDLLAELEFPTGPLSQPCGCPQDVTERLLREDLERHGGEVEYGRRLETLTQADDAVRVVVGGRESIHDHVVGADGVDSTVRDALGLRHEGFTLDARWSIADVHARGLGPVLSFWLVDDGHFVGCVPIGSDRYRFFASTQDALATVPGGVDVTRVNREATFSIAVRRAPTFRVGRVYLVGDAAHVHTPLGGRGMNLAMQDGADLAERIAAGDVSGYSDARHAEAESVCRITERMRAVVTTRSAPAVAIRDLLLRTAGRFGPLRRRLGRLVAGF